MKNLRMGTFALIAACFLMVLGACTREEAPAVSADPASAHYSMFNSVQDIKDLNIDERFDLEEADYNAFIASVEFWGEDLASFKWGLIEDKLTDAQTDEFWALFGVFDWDDRKGSATNASKAMSGCPWDDKRPVTGGCEYKALAVCFCPSGGGDDPIIGG